MNMVIPVIIIIPVDVETFNRMYEKTFRFFHWVSRKAAKASRLFAAFLDWFLSLLP